MKLIDAQKRLFAAVGESWSDPLFIDKTVATTAIWEACAELCKAARHTRKIHVIAAVAGQMEYSLPSDVDTITRVAFEGERLTWKARAMIAAVDGEWRTRTTGGRPVYYYISGGGTLGIWPPPSSAATVESSSQDYGIIVDVTGYDDSQDYGIIIDPIVAGVPMSSDYGSQFSTITGGDILVMYVARPQIPRGDSDILPVPVWAEDIMISLATSKLLQMDTRLSSSTGSQAYRDIAETYLPLLQHMATSTPRVHVGGSGGAPSEERVTTDRKARWPRIIEVS